METNSFTIEQVTTFSYELADSVRALAKQIGKNYKELTNDDLQEIIHENQCFLYIAKDLLSQQIVGMVMLHVYRIPYTRKAYADDLIVDEAFRKKGIATALMQKAVATAKEKGAAYIDFTARPRREASNKLYDKLGFKKRDTNVYRLVIDYGEI